MGVYFSPCKMPVASCRRPCCASSRAAPEVGVNVMTLAERMPVMALVNSEPPRNLAAFTSARRSSKSADHSVVLKPARPSYFEKNDATVRAGVPGPPARQPASSRNRKRAGKRRLISMRQSWREIGRLYAPRPCHVC